MSNPVKQFWYSQKMEKSLRQNFYYMCFRPYSECSTALIDGKVKKYTECGQALFKHGSNWDDMVFVGQGTIHSVNGVVQYPRVN